MKKNKICIILVACLSLAACQSIKEGLSGKKSQNSDEFLVQKKNPLVLPPKYLDLPKPKDDTAESKKSSLNQENLDIEQLLGIEEVAENLPSTQNGNTEEFILKNIKNN